MTMVIRCRGETGVKKKIKDLQVKANAKFEKKVEEIKKELMDKNSDELDDFVNGEFDEFNQTFIDHSNGIREHVRNLAPKRDDYFTKEAYEEAEREYKDFIAFVVGVINKLRDWLSNLFRVILDFFKSLWSWIKTEERNMAEK
ncbi:11247_t:CDS:2 [Ambispora gerdemannii]|uniref:11247_t:CDS:1 n=1 Tax=Ambispora gerdemannii TaxID=144530 RepID=A0A9N8WQ33_9GLOM|nr:11247_t:CDS:2 [Ambispora gerdemannii]